MQGMHPVFQISVEVVFSGQKHAGSACILHFPAHDGKLLFSEVIQ